MRWPPRNEHPQENSIPYLAQINLLPIHPLAAQRKHVEPRSTGMDPRMTIIVASTSLGLLAWTIAFNWGGWWNE
jgi:hypothetical protein